MRERAQCWPWPSSTVALVGPTFVLRRWKKSTVCVCVSGEEGLERSQQRPLNLQSDLAAGAEPKLVKAPISSTRPPWLIFWQPLQGNEAGPFCLN